MSITNLLKVLLCVEKKIETKKLPSQGLFYKDDFEIKIKKADLEDIVQYEKNFIKDDLGHIINEIKRIVQKNVIISEGYSFLDIKSIDVVFLFLEIVSLTKGKKLVFNIYDERLGFIDIEFSSENFNYFFINQNLMKMYNKVEKCFEINGFSYTLPSIGVENSLTDYLISKMGEEDADKYNHYSYDFTHFVSNKNYLSFSEIDNLVQIFNFDIEDSESDKIKEIFNIFEPIQKYSLIKDGYVIEITSKIDLEKIWL
jgi:hypothetical protein